MSLQAFLEARRTSTRHVAPGNATPRTIMKRCKACGKDVPMVSSIKYFRLDGSKPDGLSPHCISCENLEAAKGILLEKTREDAKKVSTTPQESTVRCRKCGFTCKEGEAPRYFGDKRSICKVCVSEVTLEVDRKLAASMALQRRIVKLNGCMIVPGYEGQRCEKSYNCEHYESCLDVAADRAWLGWRTAMKK